MDQTTITSAANRAAATSKNLIARQVDSQAGILGARVSQTARDLEAVAEQLRQSDTISSAANVADWAARYISSAGMYLSGGDTDRFITDLETLGRERPWVIAASAAVLGFAAARIVKSSSARRLRSAEYVDRFNGNNASQIPDIGMSNDALVGKTVTAPVTSTQYDANRG